MTFAGVMDEAMTIVQGEEVAAAVSSSSVEASLMLRQP
jgi:hypothetical protein